MINKWIFKDGLRTTVECTSFPYAYRTMWNAFKRGLEKESRKYDDMVKEMLIVSPVKDRYGHTRIYSYLEATEMARNQGLLNTDNMINSREFKKRD